jgi:hypothetical protein
VKARVSIPRKESRKKVRNRLNRLPRSPLAAPLVGPFRWLRPTGGRLDPSGCIRFEASAHALDVGACRVRVRVRVRAGDGRGQGRAAIGGARGRGMGG